MPVASVYIFLDSEFLTLGDGSIHILSVGLCGPADHQEFYAENIEMPPETPNEFVEEFVIPQLGQPHALKCSLKDIGAALIAWLSQFQGQTVEVCYDWHDDRIAMETVLQEAEAMTTLRYDACPVSYLLDDESGIQAAEACWTALAKARGIRRHHALADALALKARFIAVHGPAEGMQR